MSTKSLFTKLREYRKEYSNLFVFKKVLLYILYIPRIHPVRKFRAWFYFKNSNAVIGSRVLIFGLIENISIGEQNNIYDNCIFHFGPRAEFNTGTNVIFSYNVLVTCHKKISIGNDVMIGEFTSIRDSTHDYSTEEVMMRTQDVFKEIIIGDNVWIGRGCLITEGSVINDGVVIAANSVVKGTLERDSIYGGSPAKFIKKRI